MPKPDYQGAMQDLLEILETEPKSEASSGNNKIIDVTEESSETAYQFTKNNLLVIKPLKRK